MRKIDNIDSLLAAFAILEDALDEYGVRLDMGARKSEMTLTDIRDQYADRAIGRWRVDESGLSYYDDEEALPSVTVQTAKQVVAYSLEIVKEHRAKARKEHS